MAYKLNIKPFTDYSLNCYMNNAVSIICSRHPSYRKAAYLHLYRYFAQEYEGFKSLSVNYLPEFVNCEKFIKPEKYYFKDKMNFLEEVRQVLLGNRVIFVGIDLYEWVDNSLAWHGYHWSHYAMITGFDTERAVYFTFEDDFSGYDEHEIPEERFITSFSNSTCKDPPAYIIDFPELNEPYIFTAGDILQMTRELKQEIGKVDVSQLWEISDKTPELDKILGNFFAGASRIRFRHIGNKFLFKTLDELHYIKNGDVLNELLDAVEEIKNGWIVIMNIFLRGMKEKRIENKLPMVRQHARRLLEKEYNLWDRLISAIAAAIAA